MSNAVKLEVLEGYDQNSRAFCTRTPRTGLVCLCVSSSTISRIPWNPYPNVPKRTTAGACECQGVAPSTRHRLDGSLGKYDLYSIILEHSIDLVSASELTKGVVTPHVELSFACESCNVTRSRRHSLHFGRQSTETTWLAPGLNSYLCSSVGV